MNFFGITLTRSRNIDPGLRLQIVRNRWIKESETILDVGANRGQWLAKVVDISEEKKIVALEPIKEIFQQLKCNFMNHKNIIVLNYAVGRKSGSRDIYVASNQGMSSSFLEIAKFHKLGAPTVGTVKTQSVEVRDLSSIIRDFNLRNTYLKIDVQGFELEVLKSIKSSDWSKIKFIEVEVNLVENYESSSLIEEVICFLRTRGFNPFRIEPGFGVKNFGQQLQMDILFCHEE
jgi:FkbM family methyltransferase